MSFQFQIKAASSLARLRLLNVLPVCLRRLDPRRLDVIFDLKPESFGRFRRFTALLLCCLLFVAGCGYRFAGTAGNRIATDQSVWVAFIVNETISPTAQTVIRRALYEECHAMRGLYPADKEATAELIVRGKLTSYTLKAISYTAIDQAKEYRLLISVDLELHRKGETAPVWKGLSKASQDFPASTDLALQHNAEEAALEAASRTLARKFLVSVEQAY